MTAANPQGESRKYLSLIYSEETSWTESEREKCFAESTQLTHELHARKQYLGAAPLHPVALATSVRVRDGKRFVTDGPFAETKELIAGFWIWQVKSMEEALEWVRRCPNPHQEDGEIEIRPLFAAEDFAPCDPTGELRAAEARLREQVTKR